jgi:drug/metabolite transporter (DMT)-like permease
MCYSPSPTFALSINYTVGVVLLLNHKRGRQLGPLSYRGEPTGRRKVRGKGWRLNWQVSQFYYRFQAYLRWKIHLLLIIHLVIKYGTIFSSLQQTQTQLIRSY